ncbi:cupredoxin domain-containing protein [Nitrogeniibacter mangrovi]|uniref:Cupredoxin domain-containing protein n=1 Tax=Nitrogeniibacter mangrovi TaxID=2016596 RepID=A0A6C1B054_9RHOO|nr:cupredoxin domain-containing protein [Nitrogeniibacter mangrovi]QID16275.1 cupredoxin domain-containing protein [Nitrogeniibacter mangrovi]
MTLNRALCLTLACLALGAPVAARADLPTFEIVAQNGRFSPETVEVPANTRFRVRIVNRNAGPEEFETATPFRELVLAPGVTRTTVYPPLKPGTYPFFGEFHKATAKGRFIAK